MAAQFVTIGHSNRSLDEFLDMLRAAEVDMLIDVRRFPRSRTNPVYNIDRLPEDLARMGIDYRHCLALGGRRPRQPGVDGNLKSLGDGFATALDALKSLGRDRRVALMCSEAVWWRCHRRIIVDYLLLDGHAVDHLMGPGHVEHATPTPGARKTLGGGVVYPASPSPGGV